jgi:hypothetical protein
LAWAGARNGRPLDVEAKNAKAFMTSWWALTKEAAARVNHKDAQLGAALAYYSIFSLGPLMVIAIAIVGLVFGQEKFPAASRLPARAPWTRCAGSVFEPWACKTGRWGRQKVWLPTWQVLPEEIVAGTPCRD